MTTQALFVIFSALAIAACLHRSVEAVVCSAACIRGPARTLTCGPGPGGSSGQQEAGQLQLVLNTTLHGSGLDSDSRLDVEIKTTSAGGETATEALVLESVPQSCSWSGAQSLRIVYGSNLPTLSIFATATNASKLEVHGQVLLDSLLPTMQGVVGLYATSAKLSQAVGNLPQLKSLVLGETVRRTSAEKAAGLLVDLPGLLSAKFVGGRLGRLRGGDLVRLPTLRYLYLIQCGLTALDTDAFQSLANSHLLHLVIERNTIDSLPPRVFHKLGGSLEQLRLTRNSIVSVDAETFAGLSSLEMLDLSHNNLGVLPQGAFAGLGNLRTLNLGANPLLRIFSPDSIRTGGSRILCPLENLMNLHVDSSAGIDCREFASSRVRILTSIWTTETALLRRPNHGRRVLHCEWVVGNWCARESLEQPLQQQQSTVQQQQPTSLLLLLILGSISLAHLVVVLLIIAMCRRSCGLRRSSRRCPADGGTLHAAGIVGGDDGNGCGTYSLAGDGCGGRDSLLVATSSDSAAAVLVSFQSKTSSGGQQKLGNGDLEDEAYSREKTCYEFDEDA